MRHHGTHRQVLKSASIEQPAGAVHDFRPNLLVVAGWLGHASQLLKNIILIMFSNHASMQTLHTTTRRQISLILGGLGTTFVHGQPQKHGTTIHQEIDFKGPICRHQ
jgi:hypothetical protein